MGRWIDRLLALLKWPVAAVAIFVLPASIRALVGEIEAVAEEEAFVPLGIGFVAYALAWWFLLRRPSWGSLVSTFEHELTHAIFALLTFHRVTGMRVTWRSGGHTTFEGGINWLVLLAPYFFPTASLIAVGVSQLFAFATVGLFVLGATLAYHVTSTWRETHSRQTDLKSAGLVFSAAFLPAANAACLTLLLAWVRGGSDGFARSARLLGRGVVESVELIVSIVR